MTSLDEVRQVLLDRLTVDQLTDWLKVQPPDAQYLSGDPYYCPLASYLESCEPICSSDLDVEAHEKIAVISTYIPSDSDAPAHVDQATMIPLPVWAQAFITRVDKSPGPLAPADALACLQGLVEPCKEAN